MRILQLVHQYLPEYVGGTELYTQSLSRALHEAGHEVAVFHRRSATGLGLQRRTADHGSVYAAWHGPFGPTRRLLATFGEPSVAGAFDRVVAEFRPEVVHVQHLLGLPTAVAATLARHNIPYVVTLWDFWWVCANAQLLTNYDQTLCDGPRAFLNCARCALARANLPDLWPARPLLAAPLAARNWRLRDVLSGAARLIAPAVFVRDWYARSGAAAAGRIAVIPPGLAFIPEAPGQPAKSMERERLLRAGYIGGLAPQKGVHVLLEAHRPLAGDVELVIAGDPAADPAYVGRLQQTAGAGVTFAGRLDRDGVARLLSQLDVVVVPSLWYETFVFVVSEAFAAGVPVVVSELGVLAERVRDGVDGLLFPPGDAAALRRQLRRLRAEPALLDRLRGGIQPPPTLAEHVAAITAIYEEALRGQQATPPP